MTGRCDSCGLIDAVEPCPNGPTLCDSCYCERDAEDREMALDQALACADERDGDDEP